MRFAFRPCKVKMKDTCQCSGQCGHWIKKGTSPKDGTGATLYYFLVDTLTHTMPPKKKIWCAACVRAGVSQERALTAFLDTTG